MEIVALAVLVVLVIAFAAVASRRRRPREPVVRRLLQLAERRGWRRLPAEDVRAALDGFDEYLAEGRGVTCVVGDHRGDGTVLLGLLGRPDVDELARPYVVGLVRSSELPDVTIDVDPRSVRTVRVVSGAAEVPVEDPRLARGYRVLSEEPAVAAALLDSEPTRSKFVDALHRPIPWVVALRIRPHAVAVHLSRPDEVPADADDLERLANVVDAVADALRRR